MDYIHFVWDSTKAQQNEQNHKISFEEAQTAFYDPSARVMADPDHSVEEDRFLLLGMSRTLRVLLVCHCYREQEQQIRLISARKATKPEILQYNNWKER